MLVEALPYLQQFHGGVMVIKIGGAALRSGPECGVFCRDIALIKAVGLHPVVVHGGGPEINEALEKFGIDSEFSAGLRVTSPQALEVVEMVLMQINQRLVRGLAAAGAQALGLTGADAGMVRAKVLDPKLGRVGEVERVDGKALRAWATGEAVPVIAPLAIDRGAQALNINADSMASALAAALPARKLLTLTDVAGVLDGQGQLVGRLDTAQVEAMIHSGEVEGGMVPKLHAACEALSGGVAAVHILDGRVPHSMLIELFTTGGLGTMLTNAKAPQATAEHKE